MCQAIQDIRQEGVDEGVLKTLVGLVEDGVLTLEDAARRAGMAETEFQAAVLRQAEWTTSSLLN